MHDSLFFELQEIRHCLHQNPELSGKERKTSEFLKEEVRKTNPDEIYSFKNYGFVAHYKRGAGKKVLVRADFDALPIIEVNDFEYKSKVHNVSHKCGHDGHAAILVGLCHLIKDVDLTGDVFALFQPAEETGQGAMGMLQRRKFSKINADYAVALHNLPGFPMNQVLCKPGTFTAAANSLILTFKGMTSHAAEPESGKNPALAMAEVTTAFAQKNHADVSDDSFQLVTPIYTTMGERSYGVSAGYGELHFTLRAWKNEVMEKLEEELVLIANQVADKHQIDLEVEWTETFHANDNEGQVVEAIKKASANQGMQYQEREFPFKWGEDFGAFTKNIPGAMFGLGSGENMPALHNPDYDFPDELLRTAPPLFLEIVKNLQA
jgi:amidohydrolase